MLGTLSVVATPIGNLSDISPRALETLASSDYILTEDSRVTKKLLGKFDIDKPILIYNQHSNQNTKNKILNLLIQGQNLSLVTDAGTPGIADPGNELIEYLLSELPDLKIIPIPGASSVVTALSVSGFPADKFVFLGFLSKKSGKIKKELNSCFEAGFKTIVFFESPYRIIKTLETLSRLYTSEVYICLCRELTKKFEEIYRGTPAEVLAQMKNSVNKGEVVVVIRVSSPRIELGSKV